MNTNINLVTTEIEDLIIKWEPKLLNLTDDVLSQKKNIQNRTIKQVLGHLIDTASNNHQRMVRLQYNKKLVFPDYRQDNDRWITIQNYQAENWYNLVKLWKFFNLHMIHVIENIDSSAYTNNWDDFQRNTVSLEQMVLSYLDHIKLHLNEIQELIGHK
jgi:hypothetical protein